MYESLVISPMLLWVSRQSVQRTRSTTLTLVALEDTLSLCVSLVPCAVCDATYTLTDIRTMFRSIGSVSRPGGRALNLTYFDLTERLQVSFFTVLRTRGVHVSANGCPRLGSAFKRPGVATTSRLHIICTHPTNKFPLVPPLPSPPRHLPPQSHNRPCVCPCMITYLDNQRMNDGW